MESILIGIGILVGRPISVKTLHSLFFLSLSWPHHHLKTQREGAGKAPERCLHH